MRDGVPAGRGGGAVGSPGSSLVTSPLHRWRAPSGEGRGPEAERSGSESGVGGGGPGGGR